MKKIIKRLLSGALSLITTCLIMASPVAAVVYASEPATAIDSFSIKEATPVASTEVEKVYLDSAAANQLEKMVDGKNDSPILDRARIMPYSLDR